LRTLPQGVLRGFGDALLRRDASGVLRAGAIIAGLMITVAGYLAGSASQCIGGCLGAEMFTRKRTSATSDILAAERPISSSH
jgi:hypothetical protein